MESKAKRERVERLAKIMDAQFEVGGIKLGWDALIGLVPGFGDGVATLVSLYIIVIAKDLGVSGIVLTRMVGNVLAEVIIGSIPFVGDIFDVFWRANIRNVNLLKKAAIVPSQTTAQSWFVVLALILAGFCLVAAAVAVPVLVLLALFNK